ncbi:PREDICTED: proline-rich protein 5 [Condylura cristata]|uniref:proline-rich protein 5 n=1 Tax=Condylura cristata TaxID=143302 RepID=UPI000642CE0B|nr:PREDICTED: proline-rich protein 5 [Condylura cristata]
MVILRDKIRFYEGQKLLDSLAQTWDFFFSDVLPTLQAIFYPVQGVHESRGVTKDYLRLETLVQKVVSPYLGTYGLYCSEGPFAHPCILGRVSAGAGCGLTFGRAPLLRPPSAVDGQAEPDPCTTRPARAEPQVTRGLSRRQAGPRGDKPRPGSTSVDVGEGHPEVFATFGDKPDPETSPPGSSCSAHKGASPRTRQRMSELLRNS